MDSTLGVRPINTGFLQDISRQQSALLQQLGAQVRQDVAQIQTNRQLQGFAQAVQGIDPTSPGYAQQVIGAISAYPLAAQSPLGGAVINQLGAAHKLWQQEQAELRQNNALFDRNVGLILAQDVINNRPYGSSPPTMQEIRSRVNGGGRVIPGQPEPPLPTSDNLPDAGAFLPEGSGATGSPGEVLSIPATATPTSPAPTTIPGLPANPTPAAVPINNLGAQLQAFNEMLERDKIPMPIARQMQKDFVETLMRPGANKTSLSWQGYGRINPQTGQPEWIPNPTARQGNLTDAQRIQIDRVTRERDGVVKELRDTEYEMQAAGADWELKGKRWDEAGKGKDKAVADEARKEFETAEAAAKRLQRRVNELKARRDELDSQIETSISGASPATPAADEIPTITSAAQARALPRGSKFRDPQGNIRIVP